MNPILQKAIDATLAKAKPQFVPVINKVVMAGKTVMYSPKTRDMAMAELKKGNDPEHIGSAVAKLMGLLMSQAKGTIPPEVLVPAAIILLCEGLQFLEDAGSVQVTPDLLAQATQATCSAVLQLLGVSPDKLQAMMAQSGQGAGAATQPAAAAPPPGLVAGAQGAA